MPRQLARPRSRRFGRPAVQTVLFGERVTKADAILRAYDSGSFYYQFEPDKRHHRRSRIMVCDNDGEAQWLADQVRNRSTVIMRRLH